MKVNTPKTDYIPISELENGQTFLYAGDYYIKTASSTDNEIINVNLDNGYLLYLCLTSLVNPVKLKAVLDKEGD